MKPFPELLKEHGIREADAHELAKYKNESGLDYYGIRDSFEIGHASLAHLLERAVEGLKIWRDSHEMGRAPYDKGENPASKIIAEITRAVAGGKNDE